MKFKGTLLTLGIVLSSFGVSYANGVSLTDIKGHWAEKQIVSFSEKKYVNGYEDNSFRPNGKITRAEFVCMFNKVFNLTNKGDKVFDDTKKHWAKDAISIAYENGVCQGVSKNSFAPDKKITRQEASKMLSNYLKLDDKKIELSKNFIDYNEIDAWAKASVEGTVKKGFIKGYPDNSFNPKGDITRAETVTMLSRLHNKDEVKPVIPPKKEETKPVTPVEEKKQTTPMSVEEYMTKIESLGFDENGSFWAKDGMKIGQVGTFNNVLGFILIDNSPEFDKVIKDSFNMLLPTKGNELYNIVYNKFENQTLIMDGRKVEIKEYPQGVVVNFYELK